MREKDNSRELQKKIATLENELAEAKETLRAIHAGEIDALVIATPKGDQIFTLKGAEYSYRVMVETMGEGAVTLDDIGTILYCNKRFADVIETPLENVIWTPIYPFIRAGDLACFKDLLEPVALGKQMETTLLSRKGREVPVLLSVNSLNLEEAPAVACLIVSDLTEQKRNEKIIASERLAKSIFEQTTEAFVICGPDGSVIRASQAAQRLADDSLLLKAFDATFRLGYAGQEKRSFTIQDILRGNTFRETEFVLEKRHGDARFILLSAGPLKDEEEVIGCVVLMIDITERRRAEAELRQRTASLEAMNADLESFSYSISHDLRAPLRAIDGFSTMIVRQYGDEMEGELKRKFDIIRQNAERMDKLIGDILNLSRLGRKAVASESLDMKELFQEAWYQLSQTALARNVSFKVTEMARTRGDRVLITQVVTNLLSNALKYTRDRNPALIEAGCFTRNGSNVYCVKDNGIGFDMKYKNKLFGVFQRLHSDAEFEGTGVGLAIVKRIIQKHNGTVWAEGELEKGATFYFSLPAGM